MGTKEQNHLRNPALLYVILLCLVFPLVYFKLFKAGFVSWDDAEVLLKNKDVQSFNVGKLVSSYYVGNYAPLTMLSFALDWKLFHGSFMHHAVNIVLHLINTILVFQLVRKLVPGKFWAAVFVSLVFAFHPVQIETVAWVAAKNNLLYSVFFLSGLLVYVRYLHDEKRALYVLSLFFFVLSAFSKPSALSFPLCLFVLDYMVKGKGPGWQSVLHKLPFIIVSVIIGVVTLFSRTEDKFINADHAFAIHERIGYAGYALVQYIYKFLVPLNLSVIYPYPQHKMLSLSVGYAAIIVLVVVFYRLYKSKHPYITCGLLFFIFNLLLVLQFIPYGETLTADRYMYLPIIGVSLAVVSIPGIKDQYLKTAGFVLLFVLGFLSFRRTDVWKNSTSLYNDILKTYPNSAEALASLGAEYMLNRNYDQALVYLNKAVQENNRHVKAYYNRGLVYAQLNRMQDAIADFSKAIEIANYQKAYVARANAYYTINDAAKAMKDAETALSLDKNNPKAYFVLATCYDDQNDLNKALQYYNKALELAGDEPLFYMRRAILYGKMQNFSGSLMDLDKCTTLQPNFAEAYYWKGVVKVNLKQNPCQDLKTALDMGFAAAAGPLNNYCR